MADQVYALKYVTDTLSSARKDQLPRIVPSLTYHLNRCSDILCGRINTGTSSTAQVHKLKTQISSLLQDKSIQGRWASVVLIKAVVEAVIKYQEGWEFLQASGSWIRGLLTMLGKPDPISNRKMCMITLTRIFLLTHRRPTLTRELTTPHLSSFITASLNIATGKSQGSKTMDLNNPILETVLQCFIRLLPNHPAIFRPFNGQIRSLISPLLAPTPSDLTTNNNSRALEASSPRSNSLAHRLHALLPSCAVKSGAAEEWKRYVHLILNQINQTSNATFRAVLQNQDKVTADSKEVASEPSGEIEDDLSLPSWRGVSAGCERISGLLSLLLAYLNTEGNIPYHIPVKLIYEMAERILSITRPPKSAHSTGSENVNRQISREERENLYMLLPEVHAAALELLSAMISRMSMIAFGFAEDLLEQIAWMIGKSIPTVELRIALYQTVEQVIEIIGPSLPVEKSAALNPIIKLACKDLVPKDQKADGLIDGVTVNASGISQYNADSFMSNSKNLVRKQGKQTKLQKQASRLLHVAMLRVPGSTMAQIRLEIDRVAILLQDHKLQLASILNPQSKRSNMNLLPFLVHDSSEAILTEALIHRRVKSTLRPVPDLGDSASESQDDVDVEPEVIRENNFNFQMDPATNFQGIHVTDTVFETNIEFENPTGGKTRVNDAAEPASKRPRLDPVPEAKTQSNVEQAGASSSRPSPRLKNPERHDIEMDNAAGSDSDSSFEVPEIVVGSDDSDDDDNDAATA